MMRKLSLLSAVAALASTTLFCTRAQPLDGEASAHTAGEPVQINSAFMWADVDYEVAERAMSDWGIGGPALPDDDPLAKRLRAWVDRIDGIVRSEMEARGTPLLAPRPILKVLESVDQNAWVLGVESCLPAPLENAVGSNPDCVQPRNWAGHTAAAFVEAFNRGPADCRLELVGDRLRASGANCDPVASGSIYTTSPFVFYTTGLLALERSEISVVNTLAHELGHYYRAHASHVGRFKAFWYEQTERAEPRKPQATAESADLERRAQQFGANPALPAAVVRVPEQRLSGYLTLAIAGALADALPVLEADSAGEFACIDAFEMADGRWRSSFFPGAKPSEAARAAYLRFEAELLSCADRIRIGEEFGDHTLAAGRYSEFLTLHAGETLGAALGAANEAWVVQERELAQWLGTLGSRRMGRYTTEQEADDFSLEYTSKAGVDPRQVIDALLSLMVEAYAKDPGSWSYASPDLTLEECQSLYRNGWRRTQEGGASEYVFVPLGDLLEPHHGHCYRLFNLTRELEAHGYRPAALAPPDEGAWAPHRERAREITERGSRQPSEPLPPAQNGRRGRPPRRIVD